MGLSVLGSLLGASPEFQRPQAALKAEHARVREQVLDDGVPFILATLWLAIGVPMLVVASRPEAASSHLGGGHLA